MSLRLSRRQYAEMYGPTVGDQVRLGDTELLIQVERDLIAENGGYGNEIKFGGGKVIRMEWGNLSGLGFRLLGPDHHQCNHHRSFVGSDQGGRRSQGGKDCRGRSRRESPDTGWSGSEHGGRSGY